MIVTTPEKNRKKLLLFATPSAMRSIPDIDAALSEFSFQITRCKTLRDTLAKIKNIQPDIIIAEFIYSPTYGSQLSNFESLFAATQSFAPEATIFALTNKEDLQHIEKLMSDARNCQILTLPVSRPELIACLKNVIPGKPA